MMIGVRHAVGRACLGLLVGIGIVALLFGMRRSRRDPAVPAPAAEPEAAARARGPVLAPLLAPVLALVALLLGIGLVAGLSGGGDALRRLVARGPAAGGVAAPPSAASAAADAGGPTFDIVRVEPNGDAVVAGRAAPDGAVELLVDGKPTARAVADANGRFVLSPPRLPAGTSEIGLRATDDGGRTRRSPASVAVVVAPSRDARPLVALTAPGGPTVVLSHPNLAADAGMEPPTARGTGSTDAADRGGAGSNEAGAGAVASRGPQTGTPGATPLTARGEGGQASGGSGRASPDGGAADAGGTATDLQTAGTTPGTTAPAGPPSRQATNPAPVKIVGIDAQDGGRLYVTGRSAVGSTVRLYLNDTLVAPASAGRDGSVTFTIGRGVKPGAYTVRLDQVDPATGKVLGRVEVPFSMPEPEPVAVAGRPAAGPPDAAGGGAMRDTPPGGMAATGGAGNGMPAATASPTVAADPSKPATDDVFVPEIGTARIMRGDSLWQISRRVYGAGDRYTVIYDANQDQIRNPDLIYPGQIFVLPSGDAVQAGRDEKRG